MNEYVSNSVYFDHFLKLDQGLHILYTALQIFPVSHVLAGDMGRDEMGGAAVLFICWYGACFWYGVV